jgi:hypothetical protein
LTITSSIKPAGKTITMAAPAEPCIIISTSDDEQFTVEKKVIERSALIKSMMDGQSPFFCGRSCSRGSEPVGV